MQKKQCQKNEGRWRRAQSEADSRAAGGRTAGCRAQARAIDRSFFDALLSQSTPSIGVPTQPKQSPFRTQIIYYRSGVLESEIC